MNKLRLSPRLKTYTAALMAGLCTCLIALLATHFGMRSASHSAANRQLKGQVRDLVGRLAEVEEVLAEVRDERKAIDDVTLATLGGVVDTAAIDTEQNGRLYYALHGREASDDTSIRHLRQGPQVADAPYPALVARMAHLKQQGQQLVSSLRSTTKDLTHRQEILAAIPSRLPAKGWLSSEFGVRKSPFHDGESMHYGLDIAAEEGTPVYAPADGIVTYASNFGGYGKLVKIDHDFGISTRYAHNAQLLVKKGTHVRRGDAIAVIGSTGHTTGPHVHYEILIHGQPVDPARFILERPPASPQVTQSAPQHLVTAVPNGTGGDFDPVAAHQGSIMAIADDPDDDPSEHQYGMIPPLRGERLTMADALPEQFSHLTTTDVYLLIAFLLISSLVLMMMRVPNDDYLTQDTKQHPLPPEKGLMSTGYPVEIRWSTWATRESKSLEDDEE